jgi:DNA-binding response OmpR family regulator
MTTKETPQGWVLLIDSDAAEASASWRVIAAEVPALETVIARDPQAALMEMAFRCDRPPSVVFLDDRLKGSGAKAVADALRGAHRRGAFSLVVLTASCDDDSKIDALLAGADAYVCKPLTRGAARRLLAQNDIRWNVADLPSDLDRYRRRRAALGAA